MTRLYQSSVTMILLFSVSMSFATLAVYDLDWIYGVVAGACFVLFAAGMGASFPPAMKCMEAPEKKTASALMQVVGSFCGAEFFTMGMISWARAKHLIAHNTLYTVLGVLLFLGLVGVGIQGALAMAARFVFIRNKELVAPHQHGTDSH